MYRNLEKRNSDPEPAKEDKGVLIWVLLLHQNKERHLKGAFFYMMKGAEPREGMELIARKSVMKRRRTFAEHEMSASANTKKKRT